MVELASQRGFRECAHHHVSAPGNPGNVESAGFFDSLGRNAGLPERSEPAPGTESVLGSLESREIGHAKGAPARAPAHSRPHGRPVVLRRTHNSLMENRLSAITLLGQEPNCPRFRSWVTPRRGSLVSD